MVQPQGQHLADVGPQGLDPIYSLSPDGQRIALNRSDQGDSNVWILDLARGGALTKLTFESGVSPVWSGDGRRIAFMNLSAGAMVYEKRADGTGSEQRIAGPVGYIFPDRTPDGTLVGVNAGRPGW